MQSKYEYDVGRLWLNPRMNRMLNTLKSYSIVMIAAISPCASAAVHTVNTLRYAYHVKEQKGENNRLPPPPPAVKSPTHGKKIKASGLCAELSPNILNSCDSRSFPSDEYDATSTTGSLRASCRST